VRAAAPPTADGSARAQIRGRTGKSFVTLKLRVRKGKVVSPKPVKNRKSAVRYSCTGVGGTVTLKVSGPNLRKALGKKAPRRSGKLSITFGW